MHGVLLLQCIATSNCKVDIRVKNIYIESCGRNIMKII